MTHHTNLAVTSHAFVLLEMANTHSDCAQSLAGTATLGDDLT